MNGKGREYRCGDRRIAQRHKERSMLVLTRHPQQSIKIGDDIIITILEVRDEHTVRIGIQAPRDIEIERDDVVTGRKPVQQDEHDDSGGA